MTPLGWNPAPNPEGRGPPATAHLVQISLHVTAIRRDPIQQDLDRFTRPWVRPLPLPVLSRPSSCNQLRGHRDRQRVLVIV